MMNSFTLKLIKRKLVPEYLFWVLRKYPAPTPFKVKIATLIRHADPQGDWIETGTYLGETTKTLAKHFKNSKVITLEPQPAIYAFSSRRLKKYKNITCLNGASETHFGKALELVGDRTNFWLDGHFSGDVTFLGEIDSPIEYELNEITKRISTKDHITIFIDDFRLFGTSPGYPHSNLLIDWCSQQKMQWTVENDIFIITNKNT